MNEYQRYMLLRTWWPRIITYVCTDNIICLLADQVGDFNDHVVEIWRRQL